MSRLNSVKSGVAPAQNAPLLKLTLAGIGTCFLFILFFWYNGTFTRTWNSFSLFFSKKTSSYGLILKNTLIKGRSRTTLKEIFDTLKISPNDPLVNLDLDSAYAGLKQLPWIKDVIIERRWPDTLYITLTERKPLALWQHNQKIHLIDQDGAEILAPLIETHGNLPLVIGEGAPLFTQQLLDALAQTPSLKKLVTAAIRVGNRRWNLKFQNNLTILLPEDNLTQSLASLERLEKEMHIFEKAKTSIDLRVPKKMVLL
jgi:cell division protein FtsQ